MKTTRKIKMVAGLLFATTIVVQAATPVTNGLYMELIADNLSLTNGASVTSWDDTASTNSLTTSGTAPIFVAANTNFNNHATVNFGGNSELQDTTLATPIPDTENVTVFMVAKYNAIHDANQWLLRSQTTGNSRLRIFHSNAKYHYQIRTQVGSGGAVTPGNNTVNTDLAIYNVLSGSNVVDFAVITATNTLSATGNNGAGIAMGKIVVGSAGGGKNYADANIAELLIYDHALTSNEVVQVNTYLKDKYFDGGAGPGPGPATPVIASIEFSGGTVSVTATNLSIGTSYVLVRTDDLTGTFTPVDGSMISNVTTQISVLQDTNPPPANAFYKVESTK